MNSKEDTFEEFEATTLFCPYCQEPVPVKKKLLLVLPQGDKYDYVCAHCGNPIGGKLVKEGKENKIII